jgi:hypothetical protein
MYKGKNAEKGGVGGCTELEGKGKNLFLPRCTVQDPAYCQKKLENSHVRKFKKREKTVSFKGHFCYYTYYTNIIDETTPLQKITGDIP